MLIACLAAVAVCQATALRPESTRAAVSSSIASVGDIMSTVSSPSDSLVALKAATGTLHLVLAETGNATDHISGDDATVLRSVISLVEQTIYSSMDQSHDADANALADAVGTAAQCNTDIVQRQSPGGDLGTLQQHVKDKQAELDRLQGVVDDKTDANNTKWDALDTHMQQISTPPACPGLPAMTMPALDVFFERSEYSIWYAFQQASYSGVRDAFKDADSALQDAVDAYDIQKAVRDQQYCDWKAELEAACDTFEKCFKDASDFFTNTLVLSVNSRMNNRIEVKKAGDTLIHQIKFLLAEVDDQQTPPIDTSRFDIAFPVLPSKGICDMTPLSAEKWLPTPMCEAEAWCGDPDILPAGVAVHVEELAIGIQVWEDRALYTMSGNIPVDMSGALYYRLAHVRSSSLRFSSMAVGSTLFICSELSGRDCGYGASLPVDGFTKLSDGLEWAGGGHRRSMGCYERVVSATSFALPAITTAECLQLVAVKCATEAR